MKPSCDTKFLDLDFVYRDSSGNWHMPFTPRQWLWEKLNGDQGRLFRLGVPFPRTYLLPGEFGERIASWRSSTLCRVFGIHTGGCRGRMDHFGRTGRGIWIDSWL